jgi:hypothetical protein
VPDTESAVVFKVSVNVTEPETLSDIWLPFGSTIEAVTFVGELAKKGALITVPVDEYTVPDGPAETLSS